MSLRRTLPLALIVAALFLAGCAGAPDGPGDDTDGDQLPDGSGGDDDAVDPGDGSTDGWQGGSGGGSFAPQTPQDQQASNDSAPGLVLDGTMTECDAGLCINATARNEGPHSYMVRAGCAHDWSDRMLRDGEPVAHRQSMVVCLGFQKIDFGPGDEMAHNVTWNGTLWDDESGSHKPAPDGSYTWIVTFEAYVDEDQRVLLDLEFTYTTYPT